MNIFFKNFILKITLLNNCSKLYIKIEIFRFFCCLLQFYYESIRVNNQDVSFLFQR